MPTTFSDAVVYLGIWYLTAREVACRYRSKKHKPSTYWKALLTRLKQCNPIVNTLADTYLYDAQEQARLADQACLGGTARTLSLVRQSSHEIFR